jgi:stress response protein YsnF
VFAVSMPTSNRSPLVDAGTGSADARAQAAVVPLMEERVEVAAAATPVGAVRVRVETAEGVERVAVADVREEYQPSVRTVGEPATTRRDPYLDGDELVVPVYEERVVVERRLFLKEEIRLRRARHVFQEHHDVPVRRERAVFERLQADGSWREVQLSPGAPVAEQSTPDPSAAAPE